MRVVLQPAFILHTRPFRDTSLLVELFTLRYGRISGVARGVKSSRSRFRGLLRPFLPLVVSWSGKTDLYSLSQFEAVGLAYQLTGRGLLSAMYLNELLMRLLHREDPHQLIFLNYQNTLTTLQNNKNIEPDLRYFELRLLKELGYGFHLSKDAFNNEVLPESTYYFDPERGLLPYLNALPHKITFPGKHLLAFAKKKLTKRDEYETAKHLMRQAIAFLLGDKPLKSRDLF